MPCVAALVLIICVKQKLTDHEKKIHYNLCLFYFDNVKCNRGKPKAVSDDSKTKISSD
jgi:hypothetical protein